MSSEEKLKCCETPNILQYHEPNKVFTPKTVTTIYSLCTIHSEEKKIWRAETHPHIQETLMKLLQLWTKIGDWYNFMHKIYTVFFTKIGKFLLNLVHLSKNS